MWDERGNKHLLDLATWEQQGCEWNFQHKRLLLAAEKHYSNGEMNVAREAYKGSIAAAERHKFVNDVALANELYAKFLMDNGDLHLSLEHFRVAHDHYYKWGALGKADKLFTYININFMAFPGGSLGNVFANLFDDRLCRGSSNETVESVS